MQTNQILYFSRVRPETDADIPLPRYMTPNSAGMDICAAVKNDTDISPGQIMMIPTGFAMALPPGFEAQIRPRSGLASKHGITLINSPGTIDADYRGEVMLPLINLGKAVYTLRRGDRVAQMIISRIWQLHTELTEKLEPTIRNAGGFGHTGYR
ncbi:MAG: dUTP diphosphatase [Desulfococcaceae bacterium]